MKMDMVRFASWLLGMFDVDCTEGSAALLTSCLASKTLAVRPLPSSHDERVSINSRVRLNNRFQKFDVDKILR
jgi:hypothetical protein